MNTLHDYLVRYARGDLLPWEAQRRAVEEFCATWTCAQVERAAREAGFLPARYQRNRGTISTKQQLAPSLSAAECRRECPSSMLRRSGSRETMKLIGWGEGLACES